MYKRCTKCGYKKDRSQFYLVSCYIKGFDGKKHMSVCKKCVLLRKKVKYLIRKNKLILTDNINTL
jgi:hypothetical protein